MKNKLLHFYIVTMTIALHAASFAQNLGTAAGYVLFTSNGAVTNTGASHLTGNVGSNSGASTGFGNVNGVMNNSNGATGTAASDLLSCYNTLNASVATMFPSVLLGNGDTLIGGIYSISGNSTLSNTLYLNGQNNANTVFIIKIQGTFSTGSGSRVVLLNNAKACNVYWKVEGLVSMASGTSMKGNVIANNAAISLASGVTLEGRALSTTGAITINHVLAYTPTGCGSPYLTGPAAPPLGNTRCWAIFSGNGPVTNSGISTVTGDIGTNVGLTTGYNSLDVTGNIHAIPDGATSAAASDLGTMYTYLNTLAYDIELLYPAQLGASLVLTPHTYLLNAATSLTDSLFLNGQGNSNAVFVIKVNGAFSTATYAQIVLTNGTQAKNVFWKIDGAVNINDYSTFKGTIVANNGALTLGTGVNIEGRALTTNGAVGTTSVNVTVPSGSEGGLTVTAVKDSLCPNQTTTLSVSGGTTYLWSNSSTLTSISVSPSVSTTYSVVQTTTTSGCQLSGSQSIFVFASPTVMVNSGTICANQAFTIIPSGAISYTISGGSNVVSPANNSTYTVVGSNSLGCVSIQAAVSSVTVFALPLLITTPTPSLICAGQEVTIVASGAQTYSWSNGHAGSTLVITPTVDVNFSVTGIDDKGCWGSVVVIQKVQNCTGLEEIAYKYASFNFYPNPNPGAFTVEVAEPIRITLVNILGDVVLDKHLEAGATLIECSDLANGIYLLNAGSKTMRMMVTNK